MDNLEAEEDLDLGEEKSSKKKLIVIIAIVVVVLLGGTAAAYFLFLSGDEVDGAAMEYVGTEEQAEQEFEQGPPQYHDLAPVFVVNLPGHPSLLQVGVNVRVTSDEMREFLKHNDPMLRHHLLNLLQAKEAKALKGRAAKEELQQEMLDELNRVVSELSGPGKVDALFFTDFVMQ